ncbi:MAG: sn-glycerol-1-phosphate dehydrogenase, partial [Firmicutes bacterium]|nr:sn-glycerol-1-phosphate dehydrogenase [Candidatus Colimorpha enterica]
IQCGIGTYDVLKVYEEIRKITPDREKALKAVAAFDYDKWTEYLCEKLGNAAKAMIDNEAKEQKYNKEAHRERLEKIIANWDEIIKIAETLPSSESIRKLLIGINAPVSPTEINLPKEDERMAFVITKDIRDKYIGSRLLWDIGELDEVADKLFGNA